MPESEGDKTTTILGVIDPRKETTARLPKPDPAHNAEAALKNVTVTKLNGIMKHGKDALVSARPITVQTEARV
jgi:hypothetical protein